MAIVMGRNHGQLTDIRLVIGGGTRGGGGHCPLLFKETCEMLHRTQESIIHIIHIYTY